MLNEEGFILANIFKEHSYNLNENRVNFETKDIEDFINGMLSKDNELLFRKKMQTDELFAKKVDDYQQIFLGLNVLKDERTAKELILDWEGEDEKKSTVAPISNQQESTSDTPVRKLRPFKAVSIAASVLLLLGVFYWSTIRPYSDSELYAGLYNDKNTSTAIKSGDASAHPFKVGYDAYAKGNYKDAIQFFSSIPKTDANYNTALYYISHSYLQEKNWKEASISIEILKSKEDIRYQEEAEWLSVLAYLRLKDDFHLSASLSSILDNPNHSYYNKASDLNPKLNSFFRKTFF